MLKASMSIAVRLGDGLRIAVEVEYCVCTACFIPQRRQYRFSREIRWGSSMTCPLTRGADALAAMTVDLSIPRGGVVRSAPFKGRFHLVPINNCLGQLRAQRIRHIRPPALRSLLDRSSPRSNRNVFFCRPICSRLRPE